MLWHQHPGSRRQRVQKRGTGGGDPNQEDAHIKAKVSSQFPNPWYVSLGNTSHMLCIWITVAVHTLTCQCSRLIYLELVFSPHSAFFLGTVMTTTCLLPIPHSSKDSPVIYLPDKTQTNYNYSSVKNKQLLTRTAHTTQFYSTCMTPNYNIYNNCLHMANPHCGS